MREERSVPPAPRSTHPRRRSVIWRACSEIAQATLQALLLFLIISSLIGRFEILQTSMEPNFHEGERVIVSQLGSALPESFGGTAYAAGSAASPTSTLRRGQVIVFYQAEQGQGDPLIKRLIGLPGDTIAIRDGAVFVNGAGLDEPYLAENLTTACSNHCGPLTLGPDDYFLMGDNRPVSRDSRSFGPVHADQIIGQVILRYWPLDRIGTDL
jgi:signal peptidase I